MMRWSEVPLPDDADVKAPAIKNHSVTHHDGLLYCFGGYDGRRNHMTLMIYSLIEKRWRHVSQQPNPSSGTGGGGGGGGNNGAGGGGAGGGSNRGIRNARGLRSFGAPADDITVVAGSAGAEVDDMGTGMSEREGEGRLHVSGNPPPGRNGHTATLATTGTSGENARIVIIGGWLGTGPLAASDMHVLDITGGADSLRWFQPTTKGTPPGPCNMHSADFIRDRNEIYLFRGGNGREYLNDLHALDCATYTWRTVLTRGEAPQQRANHSSAVLEETAELFIFGGWNGRERLNDIHILDTKTGVWSRPHVGGDLPYPRAGMTLTALRGRLYLFGGSGTSSKCFNDLQILDRKEMAWLNVTQLKDTSGSSLATQNSLNGDSPPPSGQITCAGGRSSSDWRTHEIGAQAVASMANATSRSGNPNDEDGVATIFLQGIGPGRRAGHTATAVDRQIFVFGGSCGSNYFNDFFVLDTDLTPYI
mmetsp:Transcript_25240/g.54649  ORF Transcript_25240/g.54649 Transcript_25240/m.54649 type:complete len:476 (+) Transcript_25240:162-1589(+)